MCKSGTLFYFELTELNLNCVLDLVNVPWFPKKISDLDLCVNRVLMYGSELDADHPVSRTDTVVTEWRQMLAPLHFLFLYKTECGEQEKKQRSD